MWIMLSIGGVGGLDYFGWCIGFCMHSVCDCMWYM